MRNDCEHRLDMAIDALEEAREELERLRPVVEAARRFMLPDDYPSGSFRKLQEAVGALERLERDHA